MDKEEEYGSGWEEAAAAMGHRKEECRSPAGADPKFSADLCY